MKRFNVGSIVHFYTKDPAKQFNGQGEGPYPAIVTQTWGSEDVVNLKILPGFGPVRDQPSVVIKEAVTYPNQDYFEVPRIFIEGELRETSV